MEGLKLSRVPISMKLLASSLLCMLGLVYITLLVHIWIDTEMKVSMIEKAYSGMEYIELTDHAHLYLPYYSLFLFTIPIFMFMFTSFSEWIKAFFAVVPYIIIVVDIASMYLIPYVSPVFAAVLWLAGTCLGLSFTTLFVLTLYDIWLRKADVGVKAQPAFSRG
ncbi:MAG: hypothetical protein ACYC9O_11920 [Candidatus Latescibacterota bacterium]